MRDYFNDKRLGWLVAPGAFTATLNSSAVDTTDCAGAMIAVTTGALTGAAIFGAKLQESADGVTWADVPAARVQSDAPAVLAANAVYKLGYLGRLRFMRLVCQYTSGTSLQIGAIAVLRPNSRPA